MIFVIVAICVCAVLGSILYFYFSSSDDTAENVDAEVTVLESSPVLAESDAEVVLESSPVLAESDAEVVLESSPVQVQPVLACEEGEVESNGECVSVTKPTVSWTEHSNRDYGGAQQDIEIVRGKTLEECKQTCVSNTECGLIVKTGDNCNVKKLKVPMESGWVEEDIPGRFAHTKVYVLNRNS